MTTGILDTSVFIARESGRRLGEVKLTDAAVSAVTVGELRWGVLTAPSDELRSLRLDTLNSALRLRPLPVDEAVGAAWALLRRQLRGAGLRMGVNDSWIAATAISRGWPVVTQDDGFPDGLSGLDVIRV